MVLSSISYVTSISYCLKNALSDMYVLIEADDPNNIFGHEYGVITPYYVRYENIDDPEKRILAVAIAKANQKFNRT